MYALVRVKAVHKSVSGTYELRSNDIIKTISIVPYEKEHGLLMLWFNLATSSTSQVNCLLIWISIMDRRKDGQNTHAILLVGETSSYSLLNNYALPTALPYDQIP